VKTNSYDIREAAASNISRTKGANYWPPLNKGERT